MGAQFLARHGLELILIQIFARWGSDSVLRYVQEAPLHLQQGIAEKALSSMSLQHAIESIRLPPDPVADHITDPRFTQVVSQAVEDFLVQRFGSVPATLDDNIDALRDECVRSKSEESEWRPHDDMIINKKSSRVHRILLGPDEGVPKELWIAPCGYRFGLGSWGKVNWKERFTMCDTCFAGTGPPSPTQDSEKNGWSGASFIPI